MNVDNDDTTSNEIVKLQTVNMEHTEGTNKELKSILKKPKETSNKCESDKNVFENTTLESTDSNDIEHNNCSMKLNETIVSSTPESSTYKTNSASKCVRYADNDTENKCNEDKSTTELTTNLLPKTSSHISKSLFSNANNGGETYEKYMQDSNVVENIKNSNNEESLIGHINEHCNEHGNEAHDGLMSINSIENITTNKKKLDVTFQLEDDERSNDAISNISVIKTNPENSKTILNKQNDDNQSLIGVPTRRKRGRPRKLMSNTQQIVNTLDKEQSENLCDSAQERTNVSITETVVENQIDNNESFDTSNTDSLHDANSTEDSVTNSVIVRKRGRPPGKTAGALTNTRRGRGRGRRRSRDSPNNINPTLHTENIDLVTCARCEEDVLKKNWDSHNLSRHNNMGWLKGDEPIDFESDIKLWRKILMSAIKKKKGQLTCEKCGSIKRSANGFISHMQFCGKTDEEKKTLMVSCPICSSIMMPSSLEIHERVHRQAEQSKNKPLHTKSADSPRLKRKAAEKAVTKILEFTDHVKDNDVPIEKKKKLEPSFLKSIVKAPENKRSIPPVWKGLWKKELQSQGTITCRQLGCTYKCSSYADMCTHFSECNFHPEKCYICKVCKFSTTSNDEMMTHVTEKHVTPDGIEEESDFEQEESSADEKSVRRMKFFSKDETSSGQFSEPYFQSVLWTIEFEQRNYELHLFNDYIPNDCTLLKDVDTKRYLPELEHSMRTKMGNPSEKLNSAKDIQWKQWKRFEGGFDENTSIFFVGGPIWALAWLPIPAPMYSKDPIQYIAISTHPTMESEYTVGTSHTGCNIIQIWSVGPLNHESNSKMNAPSFSYAVAHNRGTVWCLEWCPSGCYQNENLINYKKENGAESRLKRMGMLAAACSDGNVYIYSLPFPEELQFKKTVDTEWPIYDTDPVITLVVNISMYDKNDQSWQCTKLSWTKERGHNIIAAGFSNGYVALWDLTYKSPLSMQKRQNTYFINAFQHFYAHGNAVSMIVLIPYNGKRFCATGSVDRTHKIWDLESISTPQIYMQKGVVVNGAWMTHWPCSVLSFDDALGYKHTTTYLVSLRELEYKYYPLLGTNSPTYALAVSDYANSIAHGTLAGEILTIFPHELVHVRDIEKATYKKRKMSSFVRIMDFCETTPKDEKNSKEYYYMPETYDECQKRFAIVFCDNLKGSERSKQQQSLGSEKLTAIPVEEYPFMSINRMSWNPNPWSYLWLAVGYQNGLVRLLNFKYMSMERELMAILPKHAATMLDKTKATKNKNS